MQVLNINILKVKILILDIPYFLNSQKRNKSNSQTTSYTNQGKFMRIEETKI